MLKKLFLATAAFTTIAFNSASVLAEDLSNADEIVERANLASYYAGADGRSEVRMIISDAQGRQQRRQFTVLRRDVDDGGDQQFLVVFSQPSDVTEYGLPGQQTPRPRRRPLAVSAGTGPGQTHLRW